MSRALGKDETIANVVIARVFLVARLASVWGVAGGPPLTTGTDPVNRPLGSGASHSLGMMLTVSGGWVGVSGRGGGSAPRGGVLLFCSLVGLEIRLTTPMWVRPRRS